MFLLKGKFIIKNLINAVIMKVKSSWISKVKPMSVTVSFSKLLIQKTKAMEHYFLKTAIHTKGNLRMDCIQG